MSRRRWVPYLRKVFSGFVYYCLSCTVAFKMLLLKFYSCSVTLNMSPPSLPAQEGRPGKNFFSLQIYKPPPAGHTHHLIYFGNGSSFLLKQVSSPSHTIDIHSQFIQFLAYFTMHVLIPSLSCIIKKVWHCINSITLLKSRSRKYTVFLLSKSNQLGLACSRCW